MWNFSSKLYKENKIVNGIMIKKYSVVLLLAIFFMGSFVSAGDIIFKGGEITSSGNINSDGTITQNGTPLALNSSLENYYLGLNLLNFINNSDETDSIAVAMFTNYYTITQIDSLGFINNSVSNLVNYFTKTESDVRYIQNETDPNLWTSSFNSTGDDKWLDDTTLNESVIDSYCDNNGYSSYQFGANNFNGSGNLTTTGRMGLGNAFTSFASDTNNVFHIKTTGTAPYMMIESSGVNSYPSYRLHSDIQYWTMYLRPVSGSLSWFNGSAHVFDISSSGNFNFHNGDMTMRGDLTVGDGTANTPSYSFSSDQDTGFYSGGNNILRVSIGGVNKFTWDSNVFQGGATFSPRILSGVGNSVSPTYSFIGDTNTGIFRGGADILGFTTNGTSRYTISATGDHDFKDGDMVGTGKLTIGEIQVDKINATTTDPELMVYSPTTRERVQILDTAVPYYKKGINIYFNSQANQLEYWNPITGEIKDKNDNYLGEMQTLGALKEGYYLNYSDREFYKKTFREIEVENGTILREIDEGKEGIENLFVFGLENVTSLVNSTCYKINYESFQKESFICEKEIVTGERSVKVLREGVSFVYETGKFYEEEIQYMNQVVSDVSVKVFKEEALELKGFLME